MLKISLKHAKLDNLARIIYITKLAYKVPYQNSGTVTKPHEPPDVMKLFAKKKFLVIAAHVNEKIIGAVRYKFLPGKQLYFYQLAVLKNFRNKGIGKLLVRRIESVALKKGCRKILLDCVKEKKLDQYYKKLGYKTDAVKKHLNHYDVFMSKRIKKIN